MAPPRTLDRITVDQSIDRYEIWLGHRQTNGNVSAATVRTYLADLAEFQRMAGGSTVLDDITADDLQRMIDELAATPDRRHTATAAPPRRRSRSTLARWCASTRGLFRWAAANSHLQSDPWPDVSAPTYPTWTPDYRRGLDVPSARALRETPPSPAGSGKQAAAAAGRIALRDRIILRIFTESGPRVSELCAANRQDVRNGNISGRGKPRWQLWVSGKGGKTRALPLSDDVVAMLDDYQANHRPPPHPADSPERKRDAAAALLVSVNGRRLSPRAVQYIVQRHARQMDVHTTPHGLRHTTFTAMAHAGVPVGTIRDIAGHASLATTSIYVDSNPDAAAEAIEQSPLN